MAKRNPGALRAQLKHVLAASFLIFGVGAAAAAFTVGFTGTLQHNLADPRAVSNMRLAALEDIADDLGYAGFLRAYGAFVKGDEEAGRQLRGFSDRADSNLSVFLEPYGGTPSDRETAGGISLLMTPFRSMALYGSGGGEQLGLLPSSPEMERDYAALKARIAEAIAATHSGRLTHVNRALMIAEAAAVGAWFLLAIALFALAWLLRDRLIAPLDKLRRSLTGAVAGATGIALWGTERKDEIGAVARAADCLRQSLVEKSQRSEAFVTARAIERLSERAQHLEAALEKTSAAAMTAQERIERAGVRAAKASHDAVEASELAREHAIQRVGGAHDEEGPAANFGPAPFVEALIQAEARLSAAAEMFERVAGERRDTRRSDLDLGRDSTLPVIGSRYGSPIQPIAMRPIPEDFPFSLDRDPTDPLDPAAVFDSLTNDLDALERFATTHGSIAADEAVMFTAALIEAIDRLNRVADQVSASADRRGMEAAE